MDREFISLFSVPDDSQAATKHILDKLLTVIQPFSNELGKKIQEFNDNDGDVPKITEVYSLCLSQITKCLLNLFDIFRLEYSRCTILQESRRCNLERLSWCLNRLKAINEYLLRNFENNSQYDEIVNESFELPTLYFVNWIDHVFDNLNKLSDIVYKTDYKKNEDLYEAWKNEVVECVSSLHFSVDELLLSAMTLCRYCLPDDQHIIKARCQVVLRETKLLLSEIVKGDVSDTIKATKDSLKLPLMPSNVNITINVLKDVLYTLERNTNTALLGLLIHCFSNSTSPVEVLKAHFANKCSCVVKADEDCEYVKNFDLYNERLIQIGLFAVSCSSDQNRILPLQSGLASLEALDPHLVPALMTSPHSHHSTLLVKSIKQEVKEIRDSVFLIVDPVAFVEKSKITLHQKLLDILKVDIYNNSLICSVINIGCVVNEFFNVYICTEPDALTQKDKLLPLLADLDKVQLECKIVSNLLSSASDFTYDIKMPSNKTASLEQLKKRMRLLYTLVARINSLLQPNDPDQIFENEEETPAPNITHKIVKNNNTYVKSPSKDDLTRSIFARTNVSSSTRNFPLSKLTKHLRVKCLELNFSAQLDEMFNLHPEKNSGSNDGLKNKRLDNVRESSVLYNFSPMKNRSSLRKVVLKRHLQNATIDLKNGAVDVSSTEESLFNENESLQLTEVLKEMHDITRVLTTPRSRKGLHVTHRDQKSKIMRTTSNYSTSSHLWKNPVNTSAVDMPLDESLANNSNLSPPSNVTTLERVTDLDYLEEKLNSLKSQMETSL